MRGGERAAEDDEAAATALRGGEGKFWQSLPCVEVRLESGQRRRGGAQLCTRDPLVAGGITARN